MLFIRKKDRLWRFREMWVTIKMDVVGINCSPEKSCNEKKKKIQNIG